VRIANPYRLRAGRFSHLFVASLQDGEFPSFGGGSPFLSDEQRAQLGLPARVETEAEERYLFYACLSLPIDGLWLSCRISDENGGAEQPSPLIGEVRRLLDPPPPEDPGEPDPLDTVLVRGRGLDEVAFAPAAAPSEDELARSLALAPAAERDGVLAGLDLGDGVAGRIGERLARASEREARTRAPGPLRLPEVIAELASRQEYGGTTLESFKVCPYRWFVDRELRPQPLGPLAEPIEQGNLMHSVLEALYSERPGGDAIPRPGSLDVWLERAGALLAEVAAAEELDGTTPAERAIRRRIDRLLAAFLRREAGRDPALLEPRLLEAGFGSEEEYEKPPLDLGGFLLHGRIDRVDVDAAGASGLLQDYKVSRTATPWKKFGDDGKLQLPLYLLALRDLWGIEAAGAVYQPLRATDDPRPRGLLRAEAGAELAGYELVGTDRIGDPEFEEVLEKARSTASDAVRRMREGDIDREPIGGECPRHCGFAPICRRERGAVADLLDPDEKAEAPA